MIAAGKCGGRLAGLLRVPSDCGRLVLLRCLFDDSLGKSAELSDVLLASEWVSTQWVCVGNREFVLD